MKTTTQPSDLPPNAGLVSISYAMRFLGVGPSTIWALLERGQLPLIKVGNLKRIPITALRSLTLPDEPAGEPESDRGKLPGINNGSLSRRPKAALPPLWLRSLGLPDESADGLESDRN